MTVASSDFLARPGPSRPLLLAFWFLAGVCLLADMGVPPVTRTQEARVLVTAREMVGRPPHDWLVPRTNGDVRLRKPPLAYWLSAGVFTLAGRSTEALGRLPAAAAGWATIALTYLIARRLFNWRAALLAAATLLGSRLFFKFTLLAETDALVMAQITAGVWVIFSLPDALRAGRGVAWRQHTLALCVALAVMTKGPPGGYLLILLALAAGATHDRRVLTTFFTRGAFVTAAAVALPWFVYAMNDPQAGQLTDDLRNSAEGGKGHSAPPWAYVVLLAKAALPWSAVWVIAMLVVAPRLARHLRPDWLRLMRATRGKRSTRQTKSRPDGGVEYASKPAARLHTDVARRWRRRHHADAAPLLLLACWGVAILSPLCVWGNKQEHYLMPLMPAVFCLVGWWLDRWATATTGLACHATRVAVWVFVAVFAGGAVAIIPVARHVRGTTHALDVVTAGVMAAAVVGVALTARRWGRFGLVYHAAGLGVILVALTLGAWTPSLDATDSRSTARTLRDRFPAARWYSRDTASLPLIFELGTTAPVVTDDRLPAGPDAVLLDDTDDRAASLPPGWVERLRIEDGRSVLRALTR